MPTHELLTPPSDFPLTSTATYRVWIYTSTDDIGGSKGDVSLCLHGALGSVWLQALQKMTPSKQGCASVYGATGKDGKPAGGGGCCELYVQAQDVGTLHKLTVAYAYGAGKEEKLTAWRLSQVIIRHGNDGVVTSFPAASTELKPPDSPPLELQPRLSWHEDLFGNLAEAPPPPPPTGQWRWPAAARFDVALPAGLADDENARESEQEAYQLKLYRAILAEELLPLADQAVHEVAMARTPGSFLHSCHQCITGVHVGAEAAMGTLDELRRYNAKLQKQVDSLSGRGAKSSSGAKSELDIAREHLARLKAENASLRDVAEKNADRVREAQEAQREAVSDLAKSKVCVLM